MRQCFKNFPAKFQSRPTFLAGFFSKRVTDDDDRRKTFFLASRGEDSSLIHYFKGVRAGRLVTEQPSAKFHTHVQAPNDWLVVSPDLATSCTDDVPVRRILSPMHGTVLLWVPVRST